MKIKPPIFATCLMVLAACASNHPKPPVSVSESQMFSPETKARLKQIQDDLHFEMYFDDHHINVLPGGIVSEERVKQIDNALHEVLGNDYTNYTVSFAHL